MPTTTGPLSLLVGATATATLEYFDQFNNPMPSTFTPPPVSFSIDTPAVVSSTPESDNQTDALAALGVGVATLTASVTSSEGLALSDSQPITVTAPPPPPSVLTAVKLTFQTS